jgi:hypothetical protein
MAADQGRVVTIPVDYARLFDGHCHLTLRYDPGDQTLPWHLVEVVTGQLYARISTLPQAESFMRAQERRGDASVDWASVELMRALDASLALTSLVFPSSGEPQAGKERDLAPPSRRPTGRTPVEPASPDTHSVRVPSNVIPIRR